MDGKPHIIRNDTFHIVDGLEWHAHHVNIGQFFTISDQSLLFKEQSFGIMFQQHLDPMSVQEIEHFFLQYWNRLTKISGTGMAYQDGRNALLMQQAAAAQLAAAPLPAAIASPGITIASVPGAQLAMASPGIVPGKAPIAAPMTAPAQMASPGIVHGKVQIAAPMPIPAPMNVSVKCPMQVDHKFFGEPALSQAMQQGQPASSSSSSSSQVMQQRQQPKPSPPAPPPGLPPSHLLQVPPSAGVPQVLGPAAGAVQSYSASGHPQLAHLQKEKDDWDAMFAARGLLKTQQQQQQQQ